MGLCRRCGTDRQADGFVERLHRTLLDEHFRVKGRSKFYEGVDEMEADLDTYFVTYNTKRLHEGRGMNRRTPEKGFLQGRPKPKKNRGGKNERSRLN